MGKKPKAKGRAMEPVSDSETDINTLDTTVSNAARNLKPPSPAAKAPAAEAKSAPVVSGKGRDDAAVSSDEELEDSFRRKPTKAKKHVQIEEAEYEPEVAAYVRMLPTDTRNTPCANY